MPRWNGRLDGGGTPQRLRQYSRNPKAFEREIRAMADAHGCKIDSEYGVLWDRYSWYVYVTLDGDDDSARRALEELEADEIRELVTSDEKRSHPGATEDSVSG